MSVAKDFTMSDETFNKMVLKIKTGRLSERVGAYIFLYLWVFICLFVVSLLLASQMSDGKFDDYSDLREILLVLFVIIGSALPFYIIEKKVRADRRKKGLPINDDIVEILKQRAIDERVVMERKAHEKVNPSRDLTYYFELLQKGAITQEEYDVKKAEFLK